MPAGQLFEWCAFYRLLGPLIVNDRNIIISRQAPELTLVIELVYMSGHSKWSTIKHKKAIEDAKKGVSFTKIAKKIQIAAKKGGSGDSDKNPYLRTILEEARAVNMPSENVRRAIEKALGGPEGPAIEEIIYEGYGPGGIGFLITSATDNRNRTGGEIKSLFDKSGGSLGSPGSVSYLKSIEPVPLIRLSGDDRNRCLHLIEDFENHDDVLDVWTNLDLSNE